MSVWLEAARPRTLTAAIVPVLVGTAAAQRVIAWRAAAALVVALALQIGVNYANDLFDARRGVDTPARVGPRRAVASGLVPPRAMGAAVAVTLIVAVAAGLALTIAVGPELLLVGALSIVAALGYSGGPRPYGSLALGEFFVFVFFGLVATVGSAYVQVERMIDAAVAAAVPVGLIAAAILVANNARDVETDRTTGKTTLAVVVGARGAVILYRCLVAAALLAVPVVALFAPGRGPLIALAAAPFAWRPLTRVGSRDARTLIGVLVDTARFHLVFGVLLAGGLWIS